MIRSEGAYRKLYEPEPDGMYIGLLFYDAATSRWIAESRNGRQVAVASETAAERLLERIAVVERAAA